MLFQCTIKVIRIDFLYSMDKFNADMDESNMENLMKYVNQYNQVLTNTEDFREIWRTETKIFIREKLESILNELDLKASVKVRDKVSNLEAIEFTLGRSESGLSHRVNRRIQRALIKYNGALIYQQLFNGKIIVLIHYPYIEGYLDPRPPRTLAISRPSEIKKVNLSQHLEEFFKELILWEDFEQDEPHKEIGFKINFPQNAEEEDE